MHPSHYCTKPPEVPGVYIPRKPKREPAPVAEVVETIVVEPITKSTPTPEVERVPESILQEIEDAINAGCTFKDHCKRYAPQYSRSTLDRAFRASGRTVRALVKRGMPEKNDIAAIHEFALWCENRGMRIRKHRDKRIIWQIQMQESDRPRYRSITEKNGTFRFSNGVTALFKMFLKERENSRSSDCVVTSETS
jgi:hypothetical protein